MRFPTSGLAITNTGCGVSSQGQIHHFFNSTIFKNVFLCRFRFKNHIKCERFDDISFKGEVISKGILNLVPKGPSMCFHPNCILSRFYPCFQLANTRDLNLCFYCHGFLSYSKHFCYAFLKLVYFTYFYIFKDFLCSKFLVFNILTF